MSLPLPDLQVVKESIPARARIVVYLVFATLTIVASATTVAYAAGGSAPPVWLVVATAVLLFLQGPVNTLSAVNVPKPLSVAPQGDDGAFRITNVGDASSSSAGGGRIPSSSAAGDTVGPFAVSSPSSDQDLDASR